MTRLAPLFAAALGLLAILPAAAQTAPSAAQRADILAVHNRERAAVGVPPLVWSETLAQHAQAWADHLAQVGALQHSANADRPGEGENLWMGTAGYYSTVQMVGSWAGEKSLFRYGVFPDAVAPNGDWHKVGHYTQMVWRTTTAVGCAFARGGGWDYLVCRYGPPGNWMGQKPW